MRTGTSHVHGNFCRLECSLQVPTRSIVRQQQQAWPGLDPHHASPLVVLGNRVINQFQFGRVVMHATGGKNVTKEQPVAS